MIVCCGCFGRTLFLKRAPLPWRQKMFMWTVLAASRGLWSELFRALPSFSHFLLSVTWKMFPTWTFVLFLLLSIYTPIVICFWSKNGLLHLSKSLVCTSWYTSDTTALLSGFYLRPQCTQLKSWTGCEFMWMIQVCTSLWGELDFPLVTKLVMAASDSHIFL